MYNLMYTHHTLKMPSKYISFWVHEDLLKELDDYCRKKRYTRAHVIRESIMRYLDREYDNQPLDQAKEDLLDSLENLREALVSWGRE